MTASEAKALYEAHRPAVEKQRLNDLLAEIRVTAKLGLRELRLECFRTDEIGWVVIERLKALGYSVSASDQFGPTSSFLTVTW